MNGLTPQELAIFHRDGYLVRRGLTDAAICDAIVEMAQTHLEVNLAPIEYEADLQYPGAPKSKEAPGGDTCRRLLHAYSRGDVVRDWAVSQGVKQTLQALLDSPTLSADSCAVADVCVYRLQYSQEYPGAKQCDDSLPSDLAKSAIQKDCVTHKNLQEDKTAKMLQQTTLQVFFKF